MATEREAVAEAVVGTEGGNEEAEPAEGAAREDAAVEGAARPGRATTVARRGTSRSTAHTGKNTKRTK